MFKTVMLLNDFTVFTVTFDQLNQWVPKLGGGAMTRGRGKAEATVQPADYFTKETSAGW